MLVFAPSLDEYTSLMLLPLRTGPGDARTEMPNGPPGEPRPPRPMRLIAGDGGMVVDVLVVMVVVVVVDVVAAEDDEDGFSADAGARFDPLGTNGLPRKLNSASAATMSLCASGARGCAGACACACA